MRHRRGRRRPDHRDLPREQVVHRRSRAAIRHIDDLDPGERVQHQQAEMMRRADAGGAGGELAGLGPRQRQQFTDIVRFERRAREQQQRRSGDAGDRREVRDHVIRHAGVQPLVQHRGAFHQQQRVAVGRGLGDGVSADHAAGGGSVLHHHGLLQPLGQLLRDQPADRIDAAAGTDRHHDGDLARWIELGLRRWREQHQQADDQCLAHRVHGRPPRS